MSTRPSFLSHDFTPGIQERTKNNCVLCGFGRAYHIPAKAPVLKSVTYERGTGGKVHTTVLVDPQFAREGVHTFLRGTVYTQEGETAINADYIVAVEDWNEEDE